MLSQPNIADLNLSIALGNGISRLRLPDAQGLQDAFLRADLGPGNLVSILTRFAAHYPTMYYGQTAGVTLILFNGVEDVSMAAGLASGYYLTQGGGFSRTTNRWITDAIDWYVSQLAGNHFTFTGNFIIAGYSAGGALAYNMARYLTDRYQVPEPVVITFGGCKPGDRTLAQSFSPLFGVRWMNTDDPVPLFPFNLTTYTLYNPLAAFDDLVFVSNFCQPPGGVEIFPNGTGRGSVIPTTAAPSPLLNFATWLLGETQAENGPHSIATYIDRIALAQRQQPSPRLNNAQGAPAEVPAIPSPQEAQAGRQAAVQTVFQLAVQQGGQPIIVPDEEQFTVARESKIWNVYFRGQQVAIGPGKHRARALARAGNNFLRRLQVQAICDPESIVEMFQEYCNAATDPNSGFQPTMNTLWTVQ